MSISQLLLMRQELVLILAALILLVLEIFHGDKEKSKLVWWAIGLFGLVTVTGMIPGESGSLFGGSYQTSALTQAVKNLLNVGAFIVFLQSVHWIRSSEDNLSRLTEYFLLMISTLVGMNYMISAGDFLMFYLGLELATIPIAALAAYDRYKMESAESGIKMILSAAVATGTTLMGISLLYGTTGSVYFSEMLPMLSGSPVQVLGMLFFFAGLGFKISIVPFHLWTADVYQGAPINVTAYLSVVSKGAAVFTLTLILYKVFGSMAIIWKNALWATAVATMTIGNLFAIRQQNMKRFLAFSSIAQAGFILLGIIAGTQLGMASVVFFIAVYIFSNLGAFGVVSAIYEATGKEKRDDYDGLYGTNPRLALILTLAFFSLAGIPPLAGFFGKLFLFTAAAKEAWFGLVLIATLNAIISLYYYLLVVKAMFINKSENPIGPIREDMSTKISLYICLAGMLVIGFISIIFEYLHGNSFGL